MKPLTRLMIMTVGVLVLSSGTSTIGQARIPPSKMTYEIEEVYKTAPPAAVPASGSACEAALRYAKLIEAKRASEVPDLFAENGIFLFPNNVYRGRKELHLHYDRSTANAPNPIPISFIDSGAECVMDLAGGEIGKQRVTAVDHFTVLPNGQISRLVIYVQSAGPRATGANAPTPADGATASQPVAAAPIVPFKIAVPDGVLRDLKERLTRARFPEGIPGMNWNDGTDLTYLKEFVAYWRDRYDWRAEERRLNQFAQFTTAIDDIDIHFVHQRSKDPKAIPLLLLNGWPSSFVEYAKVIMPLVDPVAHGASGAQAFHVVVPAMPGFPFSGKRTTYGYTPDRIARMWVTLMARLGYSHYAIAASDWGAEVGERVAMFDAAHVRAFYVQDMAPTGNMRGGVGTAGGPVRSRWLMSMSGPNTALPQTRGYGLSDSPVDLAAWMLGSYRWLPDNGGNIESVYTKDELLTNIMVYWVTNSGTSAARIYYETTVGPNGELLEFFSGHHPADPNWKVTVPTGSAIYPGSRHPRYVNDSERTAQQALAREHFNNIVYWSEPARGGHFAAEEQPQIWLDDVRKFFTVAAQP